MAIIETLETDCFVLRDALCGPDVSKNVRRRARALLKIVFDVQQGLPETPNDAQMNTLVRLSKAVDDLLQELQPTPQETIGNRVKPLEPVRLKSAIRSGFLDRVDDTYSRIDDRINEMVDWFWVRCGENPNADKEAAAEAERIRAAIGDDGDLEFVWGRRRR